MKNGGHESGANSCNIPIDRLSHLQAPFCVRRVLRPVIKLIAVLRQTECDQ